MLKIRTNPTFIAIFFLIGFASPVISAETQAQTPKVYEEKGQQLMEEASDKLKAYNTLKIEFTYVMENTNQDILEKMEGTLYSEGDKYRMGVGGNLFVSDGTTTWAYMEDIDEVHITDTEDTEGALTPTSLLNEFDSQFRSTFIRQEQHSGKLVDLVDLVPNDPQTFFKYRIAIDATSKMTVYATAYDRHGGMYTYTIKKYEGNIPIPDDTFSFSPEDYPDIEIIDLRW